MISNFVKYEFYLLQRVISYSKPYILYILHIHFTYRMKVARMLGLENATNVDIGRLSMNGNIG